MKHQHFLTLFRAAAISALLSMCACNRQQQAADPSHPNQTKGSETASESSAKAETGLCSEHNVPEGECAICKPDKVLRLKPGESMKLRLASTNSAELAGLQFGAVVTGPLSESIDCMAEVTFNQNKLAQIAAPVSGIIQSVDIDLGSTVQAQQPVARIWSASIAEAVAKAVLSHQNLERETKLRTARVTSEKELQEAEAVHRAACQQLRTLGFTEDQIDELGHKPQEQVMMQVRAPFNGEIVERTAVQGSLVELGKPLCTIADLSTMWAMLQVPESALSRVEPGQTVELKIDSMAGETCFGKLTWIGPGIDERSRMARVRAEFANPRHLLKDKMFATAHILVRKDAQGILIPGSAAQYVDAKPFVFVKMAGDLFEVRAVELGTGFEGKLEVRAGLKPQEQVVVSHAFALKSAMLMSRLGAGCADD